MLVELLHSIKFNDKLLLYVNKKPTLVEIDFFKRKKKEVNQIQLIYINAMITVLEE